jgi:prepilin-type N-terminal cleavage/methylation domain-containing protein
MQIFSTQKNATWNRGFTLVETLVAVTVLLLVIVGPMTVAQKGIQNAYFANEQVTAVFLAQEAGRRHLELVWKS